MPSQIAGSRFVSSSGAAMLRRTVIRRPSAVSAGLARSASASACAAWAVFMRCSNWRFVSGSGSKITVPASPSTSAKAGGRPSHDSGPTPTTMGVPRARANIATCEEDEPAARTMAPPRLQSAARKAEGEISSLATIEPPLIAEEFSEPFRRSSTRSRISIRSATRARKYSSSAERYPAISALSAERHAWSAGMPVAMASNAPSASASSPSIAT